MLIGSSCLLAAASSSQPGVTQLASESTTYRYNYTEEDIAVLKEIFPWSSFAKGRHIKVTLTQIMASNEPTGIFFGENYFTSQGSPKGPKFWPDGYYKIEEHEPQLICDMDDLFSKEKACLFPLPKDAQADMTTPGYDRNGDNEPRLGRYTFTPEEVARIKEYLISRITTTDPIVTTRVREIIEAEVNPDVKYPVVYTRSDAEWLPSRVTNYAEGSHGPRRKTTDSIWIADRVVEPLGTQMAKQRHQENLQKVKLQIQSMLSDELTASRGLLVGFRTNSYLPTDKK
jgi:hypothetical protein